MSPISKVHTPCKNCVFATYDQITQTGCAIGYIDKYKIKGTEIIEVYDEEKEFYVVNNKKCIGYRENKWFGQYQLEHGSLEEKIAKFKSLNHIDYLIIIDLKNFKSLDMDNLKKSIQSIEHQPSKAIFIRYQSDKNFPYEKIKEFFDSTKINCKWRIQTMLDDSLSQEDTLRNITNLNKGYRFILWINNPVSDINSVSQIINKANKIVYQDLDSIVAIKNIQASAILFSAASYRWSIVAEKENLLDSEENYIII